ncbi:hypothetical protein PI124_g13314 [Phytophthora idaei]|nr:hypothetical protein PI125_g12799 [Phytophthora idaei]KAG3148191.1 hypothetical protein PI126_g12553 [Phytophthora idaei]KAG3241837.1 hypothetical protein PI124_g13314 [Phytophthora idaei]
MLEDHEESRREELDRYPVDVGDNDTDVTSTCPILDGMYRDGGADVVLRLTNFSPRDPNVLWFSLRNHVVRCWNVGRGRRSTFAAKDVFFMLLVVMKYGGTWDMLARIFRIKTPTFIKTITGFIEIVAPKLHEAWVASQLDDSSMRALVTSGHTFQNFPCALYATDVTFQQSNRPSGSMAETMPFYSAKHKLYGFKVEVFVNPR